MNGQATFDQVWAIHYVAFNAEDEDRVRLEVNLQAFMDMGLIVMDGDLIKFAGTDQEAMYAKYYARKRGERRVVGDIRPDLLMTISVQVEIASEAGWEDIRVINLNVDDQENDKESIHSLARALVGVEESEEIASGVFRSEDRSQIGALYAILLERIAKGGNVLCLAEIDVRASWMAGRMAVYSESGEDDETCQSAIARLERVVQDIASRGVAVGVSVTSETHEYVVPEVEELAERMLTARNPQLRRRLAEAHSSAMQFLYVNGEDRELAMRHRDWSYAFDPDPTDVSVANGLAYAFMADGQLEVAERLLVRGSTLRGDHSDEALVPMNLGVVKLMKGEVREAVEQFERSVEASARFEPEDQRIACLHVPKIVDGIIELEEVWHPSMVEAAKAGLRVAQDLAAGIQD